MFLDEEVVARVEVLERRRSTAIIETTCTVPARDKVHAFGLKSVYMTVLNVFVLFLYAPTAVLEGGGGGADTL